MREIGLLAAAGAVGTLCRYGLSLAVLRCVGPGFPWGTLVVNVLGCFLFGLIVAITGPRLPAGGPTQLVLLTGFMGAFTTFSTYAFDTSDYLRNSQWLLAAANFVAQNALGLAAVFLGFLAGRSL